MRYDSLLPSSIRFPLLFVALAALPALAQPDRLSQTIHETERVPLTGSIHPLAKAEFDQGPACR
jgi:hypothetical protein